MAKQSGNQDDGVAVTEGATPTADGDAKSSHYLEIVWSSPVFTDAAPASKGSGSAPSQGAAAPDPRKYVHAFESDFLDQVAFSWDLSYDDADDAVANDPAHHLSDNQSRTTAGDVRLLDIYPLVEATAAGAAVPPLRAPDHEVSAVHVDFTAPGVVPAPDSASGGEPAAKDGDWRPQGMVFFETLSLKPRPPRSVVYSSSAEVIERPRVPKVATQESLVLPLTDVPPVPAGAEQAACPTTAAVKEATKPFFEIPDIVPPPTHGEDTAEIRQKKPKVRGPLHRMLNILSWCVLITFFLTVAISLLYIRYARARLYDDQPGGSGKIVHLVVSPGDTFRQVADSLNRNGLFGSYMGINDWYLLRYLAHVNENSDKLKPGAYRLTSSMSLNTIYGRLISGSQDFKITIPEGKTAKEVAAQVAKQYDTFSPDRFMELVQDQTFIARLGLDVPSLEGYLYPSTYFYGPGMKEEDLIRLMVATFKQSVESKLKEVPKQDELSFHEHVVMASLIEKEARMDEDRPLIASVIFNRLKQNMLLQVDATVNFALGEWRRLSYDDLKIDSPYNTYKIKGLPPGPICSPRAASILATYAPAQTDFIYYVYQGDGRHAFSATYEEFLANKRQYLKSQVAPVAESPEVPVAEADAGTTKTVAGTGNAPLKRTRK